MLPGDGGGSAIWVETAALETMAGQISRVAGGTSSARGSVAGTASAAAGCADPAAGAYELLQRMLASALGTLDVCAGSLSRATISASGAYTTTDAAAMSCPAQP